MSVEAEPRRLTLEELETAWEPTEVTESEENERLFLGAIPELAIRMGYVSLREAMQHGNN